jgi:hypothetical protein
MVPLSVFMVFYPKLFIKPAVYDSQEFKSGPKKNTRKK